MLAFALAFFRADEPIVLAVAVIGFGVASALYLPAMTTYGAELFAPAHRGRATATAWAVNRVAAATAPLLLLPLVRSDNDGLVVIVVAGTLLASIVVLVFFAPAPRKS
jgi:putative MFS transporter